MRCQIAFLVCRVLQRVVSAPPAVAGTGGLVVRPDEEGCVVDEDVDPAEGGNGVLGQLGHGARVGQVGPTGGVAVALQSRQDTPGGSLVTVVVDENPVTATVCERPRGGGTDTS